MDDVKDILEKLEKGDNMTRDEKKQLLQLYWLICKHEHHIFRLVYRYHECDTWEDIFRDYDPTYLADKAEGVKIALDNLEDL